MNLPKGPDSLCFDKDEFMKVRQANMLVSEHDSSETSNVKLAV